MYCEYCEKEKKGKYYTLRDKITDICIGSSIYLCDDCIDDYNDDDNESCIACDDVI